MARRSPKTIGLPLAKELKANKLEDIQSHFKKMKDALDNMYKFLLSDISTIEVGGGTSDAWIYFGGKNAVGSARVGLVGTTWECQHYIAGTYVGRLESKP